LAKAGPRPAATARPLQPWIFQAEFNELFKRSPQGGRLSFVRGRD
jgi:hypothetical protein